MCLLLDLDDTFGEFTALAGQHTGVDLDPAAFHVGQYRHQRDLDVAVDGFKARFPDQFRPHGVVQAQRDVGILGRVRRRGFERDFVEAQLVFTLASDVLVLGRGVVQVLQRH